MKRWGNPLILPVSVAVFVGAYYLALASLDISGDEARAMGLLLKGTADGRPVAVRCTLAISCPRGMGTAMAGTDTQVC